MSVFLFCQGLTSSRSCVILAGKVMCWTVGSPDHPEFPAVDPRGPKVERVH